MMTPYTKLKFHLERHMYKRGQFKGDAPADSSRRSKNHFRVMQQGDKMVVRMWQTNLIEVTPDNNVRISMGGWHTSTTKANLNEAMHRFLGWGGVGSLRLGGYSQLSFISKGKVYRYYDGMTFDGEGNPTCELKPFTKQRADRAATAEFRKDIEDSGFKAVFPVLFSMADPQRAWRINSLYKTVTQECYANNWPEIAAHFKWMYDDHKEAYRAIVQACTRGMKETYDSDITVI